jgi:hypothetical protein
MESHPVPARRKEVITPQHQETIGGRDETIFMG